MDKYSKDLKNQLIIAVVLTVALPLGGVMLGVGLGVKIPAIWAIGIAFLGSGFYGCPIAWTAGYGNTKSLGRVIHAVRDEHLYTVNEIASQLSLSERMVRQKLDACFNKQYLIGYKRVGDKIEGNFNTNILDREFAAECVNCGAKFTYKRGEKARCPYCGSPVATDGSGVIPY